MRNTPAAILLFVLLTSPALLGSSATDEAKALLGAMRAKEQYLGAATQMQQQLGLSRSQVDTLAERILDEMVVIYADVYSADELRAIRGFYESPAGQKLLDKKPQVSRRYIGAMQKVMAEFQPAGGSQ